jgi:predicted kinase
MPSSGKTTVAEALSLQLELPLVAKDEIKERLFDTLGTGDVDWSGRLGEAAYALVFAFAGRLLASGCSAIVEANFFQDQAADFSRLPAHRVVQIHCDAPLAVLVQRYEGRLRHPGHNDDQKVRELAERFESGTHAPLNLAGDLIRIDTVKAMDVGQVADRLRGAL